jgi:predicted ATPase
VTKGRGLLARVSLTEDAPTEGFPWDLPAVRDLARLRLHTGVTFLAGENGSGKSTLVEGIAVAAGFSPEGGNRNYLHGDEATVSPLHDHLRLSWSQRPKVGWFLRAESFFNLATYIDEAGLDTYFGGHSFHQESHGESFLSLALARFKPGGFYVLDEPEAALSFQGCLRLLAVIDDCVTQGAQFIVATHSPVLLAYPQASIFELDPTGINARDYDDVETVQLWRSFLAEPDLFLRHLFTD